MVIPNRKITENIVERITMNPEVAELAICNPVEFVADSQKELDVK
jgi:hypothetical protein